MIGTQYIMRLSKFTSRIDDYRLEVIAITGEYEEVIDMYMGTHFECIMFAIGQFTPGEFELGGEYSDEDMERFTEEGRKASYFCMN